jgi:hypothetical protein
MWEFLEIFDTCRSFYSGMHEHGTVTTPIPSSYFWFHHTFEIGPIKNDQIYCRNSKILDICRFWNNLLSKYTVYYMKLIVQNKGQYYNALQLTR